MTLHAINDIFELDFLRSDRAAFSVDTGRREISGRVVPWGRRSDPESVSGHRYTFGGPEALEVPDDPRAVPLLVKHDERRRVGHAVRFDVRSDGLHAVFKVDAGRAGDEALTNAASGRWGGLSIGTPVMADCACSPATRRCDCDVRRGRVEEVSLTDTPAFAGVDGARVLQVAASTPDDRPLADALPAGLGATDWNPRAPTESEPEPHDPAAIRAGMQCHCPDCKAARGVRPETRRVEVGGVTLTVPGGPDVAGDAQAAVINAAICGGRAEPPAGYTAPERERFRAEVDAFRHPQRSAELANLRTATDRASELAEAMTAEADR